MSGIIIENLPNLKDPVLHYHKTKYPQCADKNLPLNYSVQLYVASRGMGKTYRFCLLQKLYEINKMYQGNKEVSQRIFLISPTADANECFQSLKWLAEEDIYKSYSDEILQNILDDIEEEQNNTRDYLEQKVVWNKFIRVKTNVEKMDYEELFILEKLNYEPPVECRYPNGCVNTLAVDDCIGTSAYKSTGKSLLTNTVLRNRHKCLNIALFTQALKCIPRSIRSNCSVFILFKTASIATIIDDLYQEISAYISINDFTRIFEFATKEPHDCLTIDLSQKENKFKINFDKILKF
jgi:hypothetical protein